MNTKGVEDGGCAHEYEAVDAGPCSDDIFYEVCRKCHRSKPAVAPKEGVEGGMGVCVFGKDKNKHRGFFGGYCVDCGHPEAIPSASATLPVPERAAEMEELLYSALDRLRKNAQHIFDAKSVRGWCETLAEADAALEAYKRRIEGKG